MRLPITTLVLSSLTLLTLLPTFVASLSPQFLSRHGRKQTSASQIVSSRQYRVVRDLLDVCVNVRLDLLANTTQLLGLESLLGALDIDPDIQLCLCLKDLDVYLDTNADIQAVIGLLGKDPVRALITALIDSSPEAQQCTFPLHAHHTCNNNDPCYWECDDNYIRSGDTCVCAPPYTSCNGVCDLFLQGCSSAVPKTLQPRAPVVTFVQAETICKAHETVCGVSGRETSMAFECIDTESTKDSCGGCMTPHPFFESEPTRHSIGLDCSAIPNAKRVGCLESRCVVHACKNGWVPSSTVDQCIRDPADSALVKMRRVLKRSAPSTVPNATATTNVNPDLVSLLLLVVEQVFDLNAACPSSLPSTQPSTPATPSTSDVVSALLNDINGATGNLVTSSTVASLLASVNSLLDTSSLLGSVLGTCGCADDLGLTNLVQELNALIVVLLRVQDFFGHNPVVTGPGSGASTISSSGPFSSAHAVASVSAPAPPTVPSPLPCSSCSTTDNSALVVGLSDLLGDLLGPGHSGVVLGGVLGSGLDDSLNVLLNSLGLGPNNFRKRQLAANANATATNNSPLLADVNVLVDLALDLYSASASLPPTHPTGSDNSIINLALVEGIMNATTTLLSAQTYVQLVNGIDQLVGRSLAALHAFDQCGCQSEPGLHTVYDDVVNIVQVTLALQKYTLSHPAPSLSASSPQTSTPASELFPGAGPGDPLVVGLTRLLNGLGIGGYGGVVVSGLIGDGLDGTVNSLLDSLNLGPNGLLR